MKKTLTIIGLALLCAGCNTTRFSRAQVIDGKTNITSLVNYRFLWANEGYTMTISSNTASITCQKTSVDSQAIAAGVQGAVQGAMMAK